MIQKEEAFLRDDLHQLSNQLSKQPFNVIAHKRIKRPKLIIDAVDERDSNTFVSSGQLRRQVNTCNLTEEGDEKRKEAVRKRINTLDSHFSSKSNEKNVRLKLRMNQTLNIKAATKQSMTSQLQNNLRRKQSQFSTFENKFKVQKSKQKVAKDIEKQFNKGPLKQKHMMNWLNQILVEQCFDVQNEKGALRGLERFGLDNNSLISRGLHPSNIFQLYQSLFVYSIGLNNLLKDLTGSNRSVMKSIWKVYAILLQYCSQGNFQTVMSELQRDMMQSQQRLKKQIEKRQIMLDKNDEIIEERLYKYIKQNKELKQKVKVLEETNEVVEKACKQMEVGFNMEVSLRLAYQYKINQIYSVHERLNVLHLNLYHEYEEKDRLSKELDNDCWNVKERNMQLKVSNEQFAQRMKEVMNIQNMNETIIEALHLNEIQLQQKLKKEMNIKKDQIVDLRDKERRIVQLQREVSSCNLMIKMMKENSNSQFDQYRRIKSQDQELRSTNQAQSEKIAELLATVKILKENSSNMSNNIQISYAKIATQKETIKKQQETINDLRVRLQRKQIEIQTKNSEMESHQKMCDSMGKTTKQIEILYHRLEEEYKLTEKHCAFLSKQQKQYHEQNLLLKTHKKNLLAENENLQIEVNKHISEVLNLQKRFDSDNQLQIKKYEALHKIYSRQDNTQTTLAEQLATTHSELEAANFRISFLSEKYTDEKFEKAKLESIYKDMLILHEREKDNQKELMINISTLVERNQELQRQMSLLEKLQQQKMKEMNRQRGKMVNRITVMQGMLKNKDGFVHPLLLEDAMHHLQREMQNHAKNKKFYQNSLQKQIAMNGQLRMELQKREHDFKQYMREQQKRMQFFKSQVETERQYFKLKSEQLHKLNYELETKLNYKSLQVEKKEENEMNSEGKVIGLINEKNKQIQELLTELQRIEDNFQKKCQDYESEIQVIHKDKQNIITHLKESKRELQIKVNEIEKSYAAKLLEKQQQKEEMLIKQKSYKNQDYVPAIPMSKTADQKREQFKKALKFAAVYYKK